MKSLVTGKLRKKHDAFMRKMGYKKPKSRIKVKSYWDGSFLSDINVCDRKPAELSHNIKEKGSFKRDINDYKWKRSSEESTATIVEIEKKSKRIGPIYSKGADQYITPETDLKTLGRKL